MGVGDGEGTDVLVAVPAVVMTHEIGQSEVHQGKVVRPSASVAIAASVERRSSSGS